MPTRQRKTRGRILAKASARPPSATDLVPVQVGDKVFQIPRFFAEALIAQRDVQARAFADVWRIGGFLVGDPDVAVRLAEVVGTWPELLENPTRQ